MMPTMPPPSFFLRYAADDMQRRRRVDHYAGVCRCYLISAPQHTPDAAARLMPLPATRAVAR